MWYIENGELATKATCNNEHDKKHTIFVYQFIRDNGGWSTLSMILISKCKCDYKQYALKNDREYIENLES